MIFREMILNKFAKQFEMYLYERCFTFTKKESYYITLYYINVNYQEEIDSIVNKIRELIEMR